MALMDMDGVIVSAPSGAITQAMLDDEAAAHAQSGAVDAALLTLQVSDAVSFEAVRRLTFAEQCAHFGL